MSKSHDHHESHGFDLFIGLILGLLGGFVAGILFAPKPGKETQQDVQNFVDKLPEHLNNSKALSKQLVGKTRESIESQLEQRQQRKQATRMAEAKLREEREAGAYDY